MLLVLFITPFDSRSECEDCIYYKNKKPTTVYMYIFEQSISVLTAKVQRLNFTSFHIQFTFIVEK